MVEEKQDPKRTPGASREILDDLMDWSGKVFKKVREEADTLSSKGKLKIDITTLKSRRGSEFKKLGQRVHRLLEDGDFDVSEIEDNVSRIDGLAEEIRDKESQFKDLGRKTGAEDAAETDESAEDMQEIEEENRD